MNLRFLADVGERAGRSFIQGFLGLWLANPSEPVEFDTLFTLSNLKAGIVMAVLSIGMAVAGKGVGSPDTASVLPLQSAPSAPPPPSMQLAATPPIVAAVYSARTQQWGTVHLRPAPPGTGSFRLTAGAHNGLPVAELSPVGLLAPLGPDEMSRMGLRAHVPHPTADGN